MVATAQNIKNTAIEFFGKPAVLYVGKLANFQNLITKVGARQPTK